MPRDRQTFLELGRAFRAEASTEAALGVVAAAAQSVTRSAQASVRLLDPELRELLVVARTGEEMRVGEPGQFRVGEGILGWCAMNGQAALVSDVAADPRFQTGKRHLWTPSGILAAPLLSGRDEVIGVLSAARRDGAPYEEEDLTALELIAELVTPHVQVARLSQLAETDPLTLLYNRRHLEARFASEQESTLRHERPLCVIMLDLDHFGRVNKDHCHAAGDEVLVEMTQRMRRACRPSDILFRWGGDEFLVLLPDTPVAEAHGVASRILAALREAPFSTTSGKLTVTASAGVGAVRWSDSQRTAENRADERLQQAKDDGRDRVVGERDRTSKHVPGEAA